MSRRRAYSEITLAIMQRYFQAFDTALEMNRIKSVNAFCTANDINKRHFYVQKAEPYKGYFEVGWLVPLIRDYGVSSAWLLTGVGSMFNA